MHKVALSVSVSNKQCFLLHSDLQQFSGFGLLVFRTTPPRLINTVTKNLKLAAYKLITTFRVTVRVRIKGRVKVGIIIRVWVMVRFKIEHRRPAVFSNTILKMKVRLILITSISLPSQL